MVFAAERAYNAEWTGLGCQLYPIECWAMIWQQTSSAGSSNGVRSKEFMVRDSGRLQSYTKVRVSCYRGLINNRPGLIKITQNREQSESRLKSEKAAAMVDAIIVADYAEVAGTGIITDALYDDIRALAKSGRLIMIGDSRERVGSMRYFTAIVPNDVEVAMTLYPNDYQTRPFQDEVHAAEYALALQKMTACRYVITRAAKKARSPRRMATTVVPTEKAEGAIDVTCAGDALLPLWPPVAG